MRELFLLGRDTGAILFHWEQWGDSPGSGSGSGGVLSSDESSEESLSESALEPRAGFSFSPTKLARGQMQPPSQARGAFLWTLFVNMEGESDAAKAHSAQILTDAELYIFAATEERVLAVGVFDRLPFVSGLVNVVTDTTGGGAEPRSSRSFQGSEALSAGAAQTRSRLDHDSRDSLPSGNGDSTQRDPKRAPPGLRDPGATPRQGSQCGSLRGPGRGSPIPYYSPERNPLGPAGRQPPSGANSTGISIAIRPSQNAGWHIAMKGLEDGEQPVPPGSLTTPVLVPEALGATSGSAQPLPELISRAGNAPIDIPVEVPVGKPGGTPTRTPRTDSVSPGSPYRAGGQPFGEEIVYVEDDTGVWVAQSLVDFLAGSFVACFSESILKNPGVARPRYAKFSRALGLSIQSWIGSQLIGVPLDGSPARSKLVAALVVEMAGRVREEYVIRQLACLVGESSGQGKLVQALVFLLQEQLTLHQHIWDAQEHKARGLRPLEECRDCGLVFSTDAAASCVMRTEAGCVVMEAHRLTRDVSSGPGAQPAAPATEVVSADSMRGVYLLVCHTSSIHQPALPPYVLSLLRLLVFLSPWKEDKKVG